MHNHYDIIVIGAGVVGANISRLLSSYKVNFLVLEKGSDVCARVSMANSAIIHSGYDPKPGSLKAKFNVLGNKMFDELCKKLDVPFYRLGSLTIALNDEELNTLKELEKRSKLNKVDVKLLTPKELFKIEPNISKEAKGALFAPSAGIIDPFTFVSHNFENALDNGATLHINEEVLRIRDNGEYFVLDTDKKSYTATIVINAAGHGAYALASQLESLNYQINPRKGEYFVLDHYAAGLIRHTIFPVPSEKGKGILVTPTYSGNYLIGPSSELSELEDHSTDAMTLKMIKEGATKMVPTIPFNELIRVFAGVRPTPSDHDFHIEPLKNHPHFINLCGIESPGFVSSPAIAEYVINKLVKPIYKLEKKSDYVDTVKKHININKMSEASRNALISHHPEYGEIICQCEKVSKGEIIDAMKRSDHPRTIKAIKKRCRAGFGKCQGGFCQPIVAKLISEFYHIPLEEVTYSKAGSYVAQYKNKEEYHD